jgi:hypothetical protein
MSDIMASTRWTCTKCGVSAVVTYRQRASVYEVVELIRAGHAKHAPSTCATDLTTIRATPVGSPAQGGADR